MTTALPVGAVVRSTTGTLLAYAGPANGLLRNRELERARHWKSLASSGYEESAWQDAWTALCLPKRMLDVCKHSRTDFDRVQAILNLVLPMLTPGAACVPGPVVASMWKKLSLMRNQQSRQRMWKLLGHFQLTGYWLVLRLATDAACIQPTSWQTGCHKCDANCLQMSQLLDDKIGHTRSTSAHTTNRPHVICAHLSAFGNSLSAVLFHPVGSLSDWWAVAPRTLDVAITTTRPLSHAAASAAETAACVTPAAIEPLASACYQIHCERNPDRCTPDESTSEESAATRHTTTVVRFVEMTTSDYQMQLCSSTSNEESIPYQRLSCRSWTSGTDTQPSVFLPVVTTVTGSNHDDLPAELATFTKPMPGQSDVVIACSSLLAHRREVSIDVVSLVNRVCVSPATEAETEPGVATATSAGQVHERPLHDPRATAGGPLSSAGGVDKRSRDSVLGEAEAGYSDSSCSDERGADEHRAVFELGSAASDEESDDDVDNEYLFGASTGDELEDRPCSPDRDWRICRPRQVGSKGVPLGSGKCLFNGTSTTSTLARREAECDQEDSDSCLPRRRTRRRLLLETLSESADSDYEPPDCLSTNDSDNGSSNGGQTAGCTLDYALDTRNNEASEEDVDESTRVHKRQRKRRRRLPSEELQSDPPSDARSGSPIGAGTSPPGVSRSASLSQSRPKRKRRRRLRRRSCRYLDVDAEVESSSGSLEANSDADVLGSGGEFSEVSCSDACLSDLLCSDDDASELNQSDNEQVVQVVRRKLQEMEDAQVQQEEEEWGGGREQIMDRAWAIMRKLSSAEVRSLSAQTDMLLIVERLRAREQAASKKERRRASKAAWALISLCNIQDILSSRSQARRRRLLDRADEYLASREQPNSSSGAGARRRSTRRRQSQDTPSSLVPSYREKQKPDVLKSVDSGLLEIAMKSLAEWSQVNGTTTNQMCSRLQRTYRLTPPEASACVEWLDQLPGQFQATTSESSSASSPSAPLPPPPPPPLPPSPPSPLSPLSPLAPSPRSDMSVSGTSGAHAMPSEQVQECADKKRTDVWYNCRTGISHLLTGTLRSSSRAPSEIKLESVHRACSKVAGIIEQHWNLPHLYAMQGTMRDLQAWEDRLHRALEMGRGPEAWLCIQWFLSLSVDADKSDPGTGPVPLHPGYTPVLCSLEGQVTHVLVRLCQLLLDRCTQLQLYHPLAPVLELQILLGTGWPWTYTPGTWVPACLYVLAVDLCDLADVAVPVSTSSRFLCGPASDCTTSTTSLAATRLTTYPSNGSGAQYTGPSSDPVHQLLLCPVTPRQVAHNHRIAQLAWDQVLSKPATVSDWRPIVFGCGGDDDGYLTKSSSGQGSDSCIRTAAELIRWCQSMSGSAGGVGSTQTSRRLLYDCALSRTSDLSSRASRGGLPPSAHLSHRSSLQVVCDRYADTTHMWVDAGVFAMHQQLLHHQQGKGALTSAWCSEMSAACADASGQWYGCLHRPHEPPPAGRTLDEACMHTDPEWTSQAFGMACKSCKATSSHAPGVFTLSHVQQFSRQLVSLTGRGSSLPLGRSAAGRLDNPSHARQRQALQDLLVTSTGLGWLTCLSPGYATRLCPVTGVQCPVRCGQTGPIGVGSFARNNPLELYNKAWVLSYVSHLSRVMRTSASTWVFPDSSSEKDPGSMYAMSRLAAHWYNCWTQQTRRVRSRISKYNKRCLAAVKCAKADVRDALSACMLSLCPASNRKQIGRVMMSCEAASLAHDVATDSSSSTTNRGAGSARPWSQRLVDPMRYPCTKVSASRHDDDGSTQVHPGLILPCGSAIGHSDLLCMSPNFSGSTGRRLCQSVHEALPPDVLARSIQRACRRRAWVLLEHLRTIQSRSLLFAATTTDAGTGPVSGTATGVTPGVSPSHWLRCPELLQVWHEFGLPTLDRVASGEHGGMNMVELLKTCPALRVPSAYLLDGITSEVDGKMSSTGAASANAAGASVDPMFRVADPLAVLLAAMYDRRVSCPLGTSHSFDGLAPNGLTQCPVLREVVGPTVSRVFAESVSHQLTGADWWTATEVGPPASTQQAQLRVVEDTQALHAFVLSPLARCLHTAMEQVGMATWDGDHTRIPVWDPMPHVQWIVSVFDVMEGSTATEGTATEEGMRHDIRQVVSMLAPSDCSQITSVRRASVCSVVRRLLVLLCRCVLDGHVLLNTVSDWLHQQVAATHLQRKADSAEIPKTTWSCLVDMVMDSLDKAPETREMSETQTSPLAGEKTQTLLDVPSDAWRSALGDDDAGSSCDDSDGDDAVCDAGSNPVTRQQSSLERTPPSIPVHRARMPPMDHDRTRPASSDSKLPSFVCLAQALAYRLCVEASETSNAVADCAKVEDSAVDLFLRPRGPWTWDWKLLVEPCDLAWLLMPLSDVQATPHSGQDSTSCATESVSQLQAASEGSAPRSPRSAGSSGLPSNGLQTVSPFDERQRRAMCDWLQEASLLAMFERLKHTGATATPAVAPKAIGLSCMSTARPLPVSGSTRSTQSTDKSGASMTNSDDVLPASAVLVDGIGLTVPGVPCAAPLLTVPEQVLAVSVKQAEQPRSGKPADQQQPVPLPLPTFADSWTPHATTGWEVTGPGALLFDTSLERFVDDAWTTLSGVTLASTAAATANIALEGDLRQASGLLHMPLFCFLPHALLTVAGLRWLDVGSDLRATTARMLLSIASGHEWVTSARTCSLPSELVAFLRRWNLLSAPPVAESTPWTSRCLTPLGDVPAFWTPQKLTRMAAALVHHTPWQTYLGTAAGAMTLEAAPEEETATCPAHLRVFCWLSVQLVCGGVMDRLWSHCRSMGLVSNSCSAQRSFDAFCARLTSVHQQVSSGPAARKEASTNWGYKLVIPATTPYLPKKVRGSHVEIGSMEPDNPYTRPGATGCVHPTVQASCCLYLPTVAVPSRRIAKALSYTQWDVSVTNTHSLITLQSHLQSTLLSSRSD